MNSSFHWSFLNLSCSQDEEKSTEKKKESQEKKQKEK